MSVSYQRLVLEDMDLGYGTVSVDMPAGGTAIGHQVNRGSFEFYNVKNYGALGDGSTDDVGAIQRAINDAIAAGGDVVYFPAGTYRCSGPLNALGASNMTFLGEGRHRSVLVWDDTADKGLTIDTVSNVAVSSALTADPAIGAYSVDVVDGSGFTAGEWAYLEDAPAANNHGAFLTKIASISSNTVTLEEAIPVTLLTSASATLASYVQYPLLEGVVVRGLGFTCTAGATTAHKLSLLFLSRLVDVLVEDCAFDGCVGPLITTRALKNGVIRNCTFRHALTIAGTGIEAQTSTGLTIAQCQATRCMFGFTAARSPRTRIVGCGAGSIKTAQNIGRGIKISAGSNFSTVVGSPISDANLTGLRIESAAYVTVTGCTVFAYAAGENGAAAIQVGGIGTLATHCSIQGNTVYGGAANAGGIHVNVDSAVDMFTTIASNNISGCLRYGVYLNGNKNTVTGNQIGSADTGALLYVADGGQNVIVGNIFTREGGTTASAIHAKDGTGGNIIGPNIYTETSLTNLDATDQCWSNETFRPSVGSSTQVGTANDLIEVTAFSTVIAANVLHTDYQAFRFTASLTTGDDDNSKTIRVKTGTAVITYTIVDKHANLFLDVVGFYSGGAVYVDGTLHRQLNSGVAAQPIVRGATSTDDWTGAVTFAVTLQNAIATSDDLRFTRGLFVYENVSRRPVI
jgi:Pectate lyase superfamily protein/Right handed beta helix region